MTTGLMPIPRRSFPMYLDMPLLPQPVRTAQTEIMGLADSSIEFSAEGSMKSAPRVAQSAALCMTHSYDMSLYEKTTSSTTYSFMSLSSSSSGYMGMPSV